MKKCPKCKREWPEDQFGTQWYCMACRRSYRKARYHKLNPTVQETDRETQARIDQTIREQFSEDELPPSLSQEEPA